jgi:hypothetical protein
MTQGIRINGDYAKSKKAIRDAVESWQTVRLVATSWHGDEYDGDVLNAPIGRYYFVGPDEHNKRTFYGEIIITHKSEGIRKIVIK